MMLRDNNSKIAMTVRCVIASLIILSGCQDDDVSSFGSSGDIVGYVDVLAEDGIELKDMSNVTVKLDDSHSVATNSIGRFDFKDIQAGTYHLTFEKTGFGTTKKFDYIFTAGRVAGVITGVTILELPEISLTSKQVVVMPSGNAVQVSGTMAQTDYYNFIYYFYDKADADVNDYISAAQTSCYCENAESFSHNIGIPQNSPLYIACYAVSRGNADNQYGYYDYEKAKYVNPAIKQLFAPVKIR